LESGIRFDDETLGIRWPTEVTTVSEKDKVWGRVSSRIHELDHGFISPKH
jgi:dTDP-4-dehydrorhamnose 3,5-epimerase-like enzyme